MAKDAYYFSHDSNAKDDPKCVLMIEQLGLEGYGIFWVLIETLRDQPNYKYPLILISALARRYNTTAEKMKTVISSYGLFEIDENDFFSMSLMERMEKYDERRENARIAGKKSAEKRLLNSGSTNVQPTFNECSTKKVKESKVNKSKEKENILNNYTDNETLLLAINDFIQMRKSIKKPMTDRAIELMFSKLDKLANDDDTKIAILNQSIMNSYQGVFELKGGTSYGADKKSTGTDEAKDYTSGKYGNFFK